MNVDNAKKIQKTTKLIILGDSAFAQVAYEYFTHDSCYEVVAFSVEKAYLKQTEMFGLPIVPFEDIEQHYPASAHSFYAAIVYTQLNRLRARLYETAKQKGYKPASFISSNAQVWHNAQIGEHCFILENNVVQPFVTLGNNVVCWSGNHIGHHSTIADNCFIASHAVISGFVNIGKNTFIGVNATITNNVDIGADCVIGADTLVTKSLEENSVAKGEPSEISSNARRLHRVRDSAS